MVMPGSTKADTVYPENRRRLPTSLLTNAWAVPRMTMVASIPNPFEVTNTDN